MALQDAGLAGLARANPSNWELMGRREKLIAIRETTGYWPIVVTRSSQYCHCYFCLKSGEERRDKWWSDQQVENVIIITTLANDLLLQNIFWRKGWMNLTVYCCRNNSRNHRHYSVLVTHFVLYQGKMYKPWDINIFSALFHINGVEINWLIGSNWEIALYFLSDNQTISSV